MPTCPPLGISLIKGFIETNSSHEVKCLDLNLQFIAQAVANPDTLSTLVGVPGGLDGWIHKFFWSRLLRRNPRRIPMPNGVRYKGKHTRLHDLLADKDAIARAVRCFRYGGDDFRNLARYAEHVNVVSIFYLLLLAQAGALWHHAQKGSAQVETALSPWLRKIEETNPDMVGFSLIVPEQAEFSLALARSLKRRGIPILFGGASIINFRENLLTQFEFVDYVLSGPGEYPLTQLLDGKPERQIANLSYREGGGVKTNDSLSCREQITSFACPNFDDFDLDAYLSPRRIVPMLASRGCYWRRCAFCSHHESYLGQYFPRREEEVVEDLKTLSAKYDVHYVHFVDEMTSPKRFERLSRAMLASQLNINYYAYAKPEVGFTYGVLRQMCESGCRALIWGIESANQRVLDLMDKGIQIDQASKILRDSHRAGIANLLFVMFGFPTETTSEAYETLGFLMDHRDCIDGFVGGAFGLAPGSLVDQHPEKYGVRVVRRDQKRASRRLGIQDRFFFPATQSLWSAERVEWKTVSGMQHQERDSFYRSHQHVLERVEWPFALLRDHGLIHYSEMTPRRAGE